MVRAKSCPNVRFYLDLMRGKRPLRKLISLQSHKNLNQAAKANPKEIGLALSVLEELHNQNKGPEQIIVTQNAAVYHNRKTLQALFGGGTDQIVDFMGKDSVLDLRKAGLKNELESKQQRSVRRVMDMLRGDRPLEDLITSESERVLMDLAVKCPSETRDFLKALISLFREGKTPLKIVLPANLGAPQNRWILERMGKEPDFILSMLEEGILDVKRRGGIRFMLPTIDKTPKLRAPSLDFELETLRNADVQAEIEKNEELGNLVLFRALLAARIELYALGEAKSAAKKSGNEKAYRGFVEDMKHFSGKLEELGSIFPFGRMSYRQMLKEKVKIAQDMAQASNNTAADTVLSALTPKLMEILETQEVARVRSSKRSKGNMGLRLSSGKVEIIDDLKGNCVISSKKYKKTASGILRKTMIDNNVTTHKILSMFEHEVEEVEKEKKRNAAMTLGLRIIAQDPYGWWSKLYEASLRLSMVRDMGKRKAFVELWGALELAKIPTEQSRNLARSMIGAAVADLERRNEVLDSQRQSLLRLKGHTEQLIGKVLLGLAERWAKYFAKEGRNLKNLNTLGRIQERLGKYLGTLLGPKKEDLREHWLRQARSHVTGVLRQMSGIAELLKKEEEVEDKLMDAPIKAARHILLIEFDFVNRGRTFKKDERKRALKEFYREKVKTYGARIALVDSQMEMDL